MRMASKYARVGADRNGARDDDRVEAASSPSSASAALASPDGSVDDEAVEAGGGISVRLEPMQRPSERELRRHGMSPSELVPALGAHAGREQQEAAIELVQPEGSRIYLHPNGNLLSSRIIPAQPGHGPAQAVASSSARDPRRADPSFTPCPVAGIPNPAWNYSKATSGVDAKASIGWIQFITFGWVSPLISTGFMRDIALHDLWLLPEPYMAHTYTPIMFRNWHAEDLRACTSHRFWRTIWRTYRAQLIRMWVMKCCIIVMTLARPVVMALLLRGVTRGVSAWESMCWVTALASLSLGTAALTHHFWWVGVSVAMSSRGACIGLVYDKSLKLHSCERARYTSGRIANLANVDCDNIRDFMWGAVHESWASPVVILLTSIALILLLGVSALVGIALLVCSLYITSRLCARMSVLQQAIMERGDARISLMVELVQSMKLIKLYASVAREATERAKHQVAAHTRGWSSLFCMLPEVLAVLLPCRWESLFVTQIGTVRSQQVRAILQQSAVGAANRCLGLSIPLLVSLATFSMFILLDGYGSLLSHTLDASTAFTSLLLFNTLKEPLGKLPECMNNAVRLGISLGRIEAFLVSKEKEEYVELNDGHEEGVSAGEQEGLKQQNFTTQGVPLALTITDATFDWGVRSLGDPSAAEGEEDDDASPGRKYSREARSNERETDAEAEAEGRGGIVAPVAIRPPSPSRRRGSSNGSNGNGAVHVIANLPDNEDDDETMLELELEEAEAEEDELAAAAEAETANGGGSVAFGSLADEARRDEAHQARQLRAEKRAEKRMARAASRDVARSTRHANGNGHSSNGRSGGGEASHSLVHSSSPRSDDDQSMSSLTPSLPPRSKSSCSLPSLSLFVPQGELWMIVGPVGSGKSSLLSAILGEMALQDAYTLSGPMPSPAQRNQEDEGRILRPVTRRTRIAYTSQVSWLESASIRDNVLFGAPFDEERYKHALHVSALEPDLRRFARGDETIVGENGLSLSGGQKARMVLARAVYSDADLYLFDEPLSAVDAHVAKFLWDKCIGPSGCLRSKTRLLVTHQIQFASEAVDRIVVMRSGRIVAQGRYEEVRAQGVDLSTILEQTHNLHQQQETAVATIEAETNSTAEEEQKEGVDGGRSTPSSSSSSANGVSSPVPTSPPLPVGSPPIAAAATAAAAAAESPLVQTADEQLKLGRMSAEVYKQYFKAGASLGGYIIVALVVIASQAAALSSDYFLATWSTTITRAVARAQEVNWANHAPGSVQPLDHLLTLVPLGSPPAGVHSLALEPLLLAEVDSPSSSAASVNASISYEHFMPHAQSFYISIYAGLVVMSAGLLLLRSIYIAVTTVRSASVLHSRLFSGVVRAPQHFFESTPSGRTLNRFAKDQEQVDMILPGCVQDILACGVIVAGTVVLIVFVAPLSLIGLALIGVVYYRVQNFYHPTSRQLKRLESVTRSPIYSHMGETAAGIVTIRCFSHRGSLERCMSNLYQRVDTNTRIMYYSFAVHRWLGVRLEAIGAAIVFLAASLAIALESSLGVGLVGLCISTTLNLSGNLNWLVRQVSEMENQLNAVERILEYSNLEHEEDLKSLGLTVEELKEENEEWELAQGEVSLRAITSMQMDFSTDAAGTTPSFKPKQKKVRGAQGKQAYSSLPPAGAGGGGGGLGSPISAAPVDEDESAFDLAEEDGPDPESGLSSSRSSIAVARRGIPPPGWPSAGAIAFEDLSLAYRPDASFPNVLSNVTAHIKAGEKIGIVGRTGAGKSTLALALFRLITCRSGRVLIDGVDVASLRLRLLRGALSVIPQDPLLFHASVRINLDPYGSCSDSRLWEVLECVQLASTVRALPGQMEFTISDAGENFSLGQRQLMCLARALVRNSRVVIMDEATAALDFETDQLMRGLVQKHFAHATVLTIAHRLNTILDADRIMVFDAGRLVEFDSPKRLLADPRGYLSWLVAETNSAGKLHQQTVH